MQLAELVLTSAAVAATRARSAKQASLAALLARLAPDEVEIAIGFLEGAPRQGRIGVGWAALEAARATPAAPVPLHIRNAPTGLMKELGYGKGYRYAHEVPEAYVPQDYLPDEIRSHTYYTPGAQGEETVIAERMKRWEELKRQAAGTPPPAARKPDVEK